MYLEPGVKIAIGDKMYEVIDAQGLEYAGLRSIETGEDYRVNLLDAMNSGETVFAVGPDSRVSLREPGLPVLDEKHFQQSKTRLDAILPLLRRPNRTARDVATAAEKAGKSSRMLYRWIDSYEKHGFKGLLSRQTGGKGRTRIDREIEAILQGVIETQYLTTLKKTRAEIHRELQAKCANKGIKKEDWPSVSTVYRRIRAVPQATGIEKRLGKRAYEQAYGLRGGVFRDNEYPLQTVQIDSTKLDIILRDEETGETVGRPWFTPGLETYSRCLWGYYLGFQQPSADTAGLTIVQGSLRKDNYVKMFGLREWPVFGMPWQVHTDNGKDFRAKFLERACAAHGINMIRRPFRKPEYGGYIERFIGTLNTELIHTLPGTTFSDVHEKGDYESEKESRLTISDLEAQLLKFIVNEYHNRTHTELGCSPLEKWKAGIEGQENGVPIRPREPPDIERFRSDFLPTVPPDGLRTIERDGVHFNGLVYYASELNLLRSYEVSGKSPIKYLARYNPADMRYLYIYDDRSDSYYVLSLKTRAPKPFSLRELQASRRKLGQKGVRESAEDIIVNSILERQKHLANLAPHDKRIRGIVVAERWDEKFHRRFGKPVKPKQEEETISDDEAGFAQLSAKVMLSLDDESEDECEDT